MSRLAATSQRLQLLGLRRATLLVDRRRSEANIARFVDHARRAGVALRPHFKTHQSAAVAEWFRAAGVTKATVSSVGQARYFADHGWHDLTLAIGANPREIPDYDALAAHVRLGLTVDDARVVDDLAAGLGRPVRIWVEVDSGYGRAGVPWDDGERLVALATRLRAATWLEFAGLLTHAGQSYAAADAAGAAAVFAETRGRLQAAGAALAAAGFKGGTLSAGDTPGFATSTDWSGLDEARPGNFVFCDLMQLAIGACREDDLACAVACPVIGVHPERGETVIHAGAVHLSRERLGQSGGYGRLMELGSEGFGGLVAGWELRSLSQEHGILAATSDEARRDLADLRPGDLVLVAPVHSCLTCEQFAGYRTLDGEVLPRYQRD